MSEGKVKIVVEAKDKTNGVFGSIAGQFDKLGKLALTAGVAGIAAVGGAAVLATKEFIAFQEGMNEVFTLLPNITEDAMTEMEGQVKSLASKMGVLPEEVVPALYQSLSAGVPQDNVFAFLETAQKAAVGGITDLETAVDGISSTVNAYGSDIISATEASDIMFTTVRLGKTTFGELASSLSNVNPLAAALGVGFEDTGAALASMTAQGTTTSKSTTQLRALLQELGKSGSEVGDIFAQVAGVSFSDFIKQGGNLGGAMEMLQKASEETGVPVQEMFSSIEAGLGALQLTGSGLETFQANLEQTQSASGATEAAFGRMNTSFKRIIELVQSNFKVALLSLAAAFEPILAAVGSMIETALPIFQEKLTIISDIISNFFSRAENGIGTLSNVTALIMELGSAFGLSSEQSSGIVQNLNLIANTYLPQFIAVVQPIIEQIAAWVLQWVSLQDVLTALALVIGGVVLSAIVSIVTAIGPLLLAGAALIALVALIRNAWEGNWLGIRDTVLSIVTWLKTFLGEAIRLIRQWWGENGDAILAKVTEIWTFIWETINEIITIIYEIIVEITSAISAAWDAHGEGITAAAQRFWTAIKTRIDQIINAIKAIIIAIADQIRGFWERHGEAMKEGARLAWEGIKNFIDIAMQGIQVLMEIFTAIFEGDWEGFLDAVEKAWEVTWEAVKTILQAFWDFLKPIFDGIVSDIRDKVKPVLDELKEKFNSVFDSIRSVVDNAKNSIASIWDKAKSFLNWLKNTVFRFNISVPSLPNLPGLASGGPLAAGAMAVVGEKGPEIFVAPADGYVIPNNKIGSFSGGGGKTSVTNYNYNITAQYDYRPNVDLVDDIQTLELLRR